MEAGEFPFHSILFERPRFCDVDERRRTPACFVDLNLDEIMSSMGVGRDEYELSPSFSGPAATTSAVEYRHEVLRDLEEEDVLDAVREYRAGPEPDAQSTWRWSSKLALRYQQQRWFLDAVAITARRSVAWRADRRARARHHAASPVPRIPDRYARLTISPRSPPRPGSCWPGSPLSATAFTSRETGSGSASTRGRTTTARRWRRRSRSSGRARSRTTGSGSATHRT